MTDPFLSSPVPERPQQEQQTVPTNTQPSDLQTATPTHPSPHPPPSPSISTSEHPTQPLAQIQQHQQPHSLQQPSANHSNDQIQQPPADPEMMRTFLRPESAPHKAPQQAAYIDPSSTQHGNRYAEAQERMKQPTPSLTAQAEDAAADEVEVAETTDDGDELTEGTSDPPVNTSSEDARHAELVKLQEEIEDLENAIDGLSDYYQIVDRLGEGTFSSVYKAIDLQHFAFDNDDWISRGPLDPLRKGVCHVALKKIYVTSSPQRIFNELSIMEDLRSADYVSYLITAFRSEDQIVAVMPYSRHRDFRDYYKEMPLGDFKYYFRCLFSALQSVHEAGIMHRDIKPANFLYDPSTGHGTLCDFGLAERFEATEWRGKCHHLCPTPQHPHGTKAINRAVDSIWFEPGKPLSGQPPPSESAAIAAGTSSNADALAASSKSGVMDPPPERVGYLIYDGRQGVRANRAGTRGFRAPEVLLKCQDQTVAIDIWSAGVILLTLLIRRFPVFNSNDDVEALLEIAVIFGKARMETCAMLHNRTFHCNIPTVSNSGSLTEFINRLNPDLADPGNHPDPEQYARDVANALDMVKSCLHVDCTRRKTAAELLQHPFLRVEPEEDETMMIEEHQQQYGEYVERPQDFADYYAAGDEQLAADYHGEGEPGNQVYEEEELDDADEHEYMRDEEVVQLQSRRGVQGEASEAGEAVMHQQPEPQPQQQHLPHEHQQQQQQQQQQQRRRLPQEHQQPNMPLPTATAQQM